MATEILGCSAALCWRAFLCLPHPRQHLSSGLNCCLFESFQMLPFKSSPATFKLVQIAKFKWLQWKLNTHSVFGDASGPMVSTSPFLCLFGCLVVYFHSCAATSDFELVFQIQWIVHWQDGQWAAQLNKERTINQYGLEVVLRYPLRLCNFLEFLEILDSERRTR